MSRRSKSWQGFTNTTVKVSEIVQGTDAMVKVLEIVTGHTNSVRKWWQDTPLCEIGHGQDV